MRPRWGHTASTALRSLKTPESTQCTTFGGMPLPQLLSIIWTFLPHNYNSKLPHSGPVGTWDKPAKKPPGNIRKERSAEGRPMKILAVDDDTISLDLLRECLSEGGY